MWEKREEERGRKSSMGFPKGSFYTEFRKPNLMENEH